MKKTIVSIIMFLVSLPVYVLLVVIFAYLFFWIFPTELLHKACKIKNHDKWFEMIDSFFMKQIRKFSN